MRVTTTVLFAAGSALPLIAGALAGSLWRPPDPVIAAGLAFASGSLPAR